MSALLSPRRLVNSRLTAVDLVGLLVGDLNAELLLKQLDTVTRYTIPFPRETGRIPLQWPSRPQRYPSCPDRGRSRSVKCR
jgi:hypothetical protein